MKVRVLKQGTLEVVGAVEIQDMQMSSAHAFKLEDKPVPEMVACGKTPYWIDDENNPIVEYDGGTWDMRSTRMEFFLEVPEEFIGRLPGWIRMPPKPIMVLGDFTNC
jgi:hypothetical protein